jgi:hypothetical protein
MATGIPLKITYVNGDVVAGSDIDDITGTINDFAIQMLMGALT